MLSLFAPQESVQAPGSYPRYSTAELYGKGLLRLSYTVESRYVTRVFKNKLKSLGVFRPSYRKPDRQQVFVNRAPKRVFDPSISNRKFKCAWLKEHKGLKGLKDVPRTTILQQPLHIGAFRATGESFHFYRDPLLTKWERRGLSKPIKWARRLFKRAKKARSKAEREEQPGGNGPGQVPTNPVGSGSAQRNVPSTRVVLVSKDGYPGLVGGQRFPHSGALASRWPDGSFRYFVLVNNIPTYVGEYEDQVLK